MPKPKLRDLKSAIEEATRGIWRANPNSWYGLDQILFLLRPFNWYSFSNCFINFYSNEIFPWSDNLRHNESKLYVHNGGWPKTLHLLHASSCEMLTLSNVLNETKQKSKQALESVQYGLEIIFKSKPFFNPEVELIWTGNSYSVII